jgi:hypothetical protein
LEAKKSGQEQIKYLMNAVKASDEKYTPGAAWFEPKNDRKCELWNKKK